MSLFSDKAEVFLLHFGVLTTAIMMGRFSLLVPAVVTVCFNFSTAYAHDNDGVGERVSDGGVMPAIKPDFCSYQKRLQVLRC